MSKPLFCMLFVFVAACGYEEAPLPSSTRDDVLAACQSFHETVCATWGECQGWPAARIQQCVAANATACTPEPAQVCRDVQLSALEHCTDDWSTRTCASACSADGSCFAPCAYSCPPPPE